MTACVAKCVCGASFGKLNEAAIRARVCLPLLPSLNVFVWKPFAADVLHPKTGTAVLPLWPPRLPVGPDFIYSRGLYTRHRCASGAVSPCGPQVCRSLRLTRGLTLASSRGLAVALGPGRASGPQQGRHSDPVTKLAAAGRAWRSHYPALLASALAARAVRSVADRHSKQSRSLNGDYRREGAAPSELLNAV